MRRGLKVLLLVVAVLTLPTASALAAKLPAEFTRSCPTESPEGGSYGGVRICSGSVPSFDGAKMDVDLTQPAAGGGRRPLIIMLHGFGGDKHDWESTNDEGDGADRYHWNNHWFATHGYYVLSYTARGFSDDGANESENQPPTPGDPSGSISLPRGTLHLKSRDYEIRDTQWLAALVAATYRDVDPGRVAVTGGSYGGIESWLQASQATWTFPHSLDRSLPILDLQVAVPKYPATDLAYALGPNGHGGGPALNDLYESSQGRPNDDQGDGNPIGVPKESYLTGLFALGETKGVFEKGTSTDAPYPCTYGDCEGPINIESWKVRTDAGDPTTPEDPIIRQIRRGLTEFRGAYYQDEGWRRQVDGRKVAVFSIQGWTDDLFPAVESFRIFKYLKRLDSRWPVELALADVGHSRAQNKPDTWRQLNAQAFRWLESHIGGSHEQRTTVSSEATVCADGGAKAHAVGPTPEGLANGTLSIHYPGGETVSPLGVADPNGPATDAIAGPLVQPGESCRQSDGPIPPGAGYTAYSPPLESTRTYIGVGHVSVPYVWAGATSGQLDARLFDVAPGGTELLMTRGTLRLEDDPPSGVITVPFYGNHWRVEAGHRIRLDLTQVDNPTYRASNVPSSILFDQGVTLTLPTSESGTATLGG
jgi:pimeloyl-ACP methyl ester carboxylesterase